MKKTKAWAIVKRNVLQKKHPGAYQEFCVYTSRLVAKSLLWNPGEEVIEVLITEVKKKKK